jgi:hypothetical protein
VINSTAPSTSPDSFIVVNAEVDRILEENEAIDGGDTDVDNAMLDPDYIPGKQSGGPKRRRKNTISGRLHKLSKTYPSRISPGGRAAECQDIYAVPTSPIGREHRDSDPIDTRSTGEEAPNNLVPSASEQNHISNAVSGPEHPRLPNSGALDTGVVFSESITTMPAIRKQFPCLIPSPIHDLRRLLKSCLKLEEDRTDEYELLVNILKTCWDAEEGTLKHRLGPSFASCQSSFQNWVGIIEKTIDLRREIGYSGENGVQFVTYLEELSEDDQWNMVGRLGEMQAWIGNLAEADATPQGLNALQNDVAVVLSELAKMPPWWKVDNFLKPILASNRKLLAWCTPRS